MIPNPVPAVKSREEPPFPGVEAATAAKSLGGAGAKRRRTMIAILVAPIALGVAWYGWTYLAHRAARETLPPPAGLTPHEAGAVLVTAAPVQTRRVERTVDAVGTLWAYEEVTIGARVEGRVRRILHDVADRVEPGELLLEIDPTDLELAAAQAEKSLQVELARLGLADVPSGPIELDQLPAVLQARVKMEQARQRLDRMQRLAGGSFSAEELDNRMTDARAAAAEYESQILQARSGVATIQMKNESLKIARQQLSDASVRAPVPSNGLSGTDGEGMYAVTRRTVAEGTLVRPGTELFKLVIDETLKLRAMIPERFSRDIQVGQRASVRIAALPEPVAGVVARVNPEVNPTTRTFEVELRVENPGRTIKPGSFAKTSIVVGEDAQATVVPLESVVRFAGVTKVFVIDNGKAREVPIRIGVQGETWIEIASPPLEAGLRVITSGQSALADGTPVAERAVRIRGGDK